MDAQEAQAAYQQLKGQLDARQISFEDFARKVQDLKYQDHNGIWWAVNGADGSWLRWNGSAWEPGFAQQGKATMPVMNAPAQAAQHSPFGSATLQVPVPKERKKKNWVGIGSLIVSILSLILYPVILGLVAMIIGIVAIWSAKKRGAKIPVSAVASLIIGLLAVVFNYFWMDIFPPPAVLPPIP